MTTFKRVLIGVLAVVACAGPSVQAETVDMKALAQALGQGGYVIVFRHGATNRDQADTDPLNYDNIASQRVLSEAGRDTARKVGLALKALGIPVGKIYTSKYNRAVETGQLLGGSEVTPSIDVTEGGLVASPNENDRRAAALRTLVATAPPPGTNTLIVTHKPNIIDAFGKDWFEIKEGEASVFKPDGSGKASLAGRVQAAEWLNAGK